MSEEKTNTSLQGMQEYRRLLGYVRPYTGRFLLAIVGMIGYAATEPLFAAMMKPLLDGSFVQKDMDSIRAMPFIILGIFLARGVAGYLNSYSLKWVGTRVVADLRQEMFAHLLRTPVRYYDTHATGQVVAKLIYNVEQLSKAATDSVTILVRDGFTVLGLLGYMFYLNLKLSLIILVITPVLLVSLRYASRRYRRFSGQIQGAVANLTHVIQENVEGNRVVKSYGGQRFASDSFSRANERSRRLNMKMVSTQAVSVPLIQLITALAIAVIVYLFTIAGVQEEVTVGAFVSYIVAMGLLLAPIKRLTSMNANLQKGLVAAHSVFALLDGEPERETGDLEAGRVRGKVDFRSVSLCYSEDKGPVLHDIDLSIEPGQTVAFVGPSGSGKTSLVNLLPRFYEPYAGVISIDDTPIRDFSLASLRRQIAIVSQDVTLFDDSIRNNILYGLERPVSDQELVDVARAAHALEFIERYAEGFDTRIGGRGVLLSGGQRQRIAIARALLHDAPILILDEATSALDSHSEKHIQAALENLQANRTTLVIAHRLSTIEHADRILVLQEGRIVEQGPHQELLARGGLYAELYRLQFKLD